MEKLDLTKADKTYYTAKSTPHIVELKPTQYISILGKGDPSGDLFANDIEVLYTLAYIIKFQFKEKHKDFVVSKLEGLWWFDEEAFPNQTIESSSVSVPRSKWEYRLLIRLPDFVSKNDIENAKLIAFEKKKVDKAKAIEFFELNEGRCVQMLHIGPFSTEPESLKIIGEFMTKNQLSKGGLHHEIYLSDFRKTSPEKLKTILREPIGR